MLYLKLGSHKDLLVEEKSLEAVDSNMILALPDIIHSFKSSLR